MITVVVPARNAARTIGACVQALKNQDYGSDSFEIIVVDDGSDDDTARLAREAGACVITQEHGGAAVARNTGIWLGSGELVCFTDADCEPLSNWLTEISAPFADPEVVGCKGTYVTRQRELVARFVQLEYEDKYDLLKQQQVIDFVDTYSAAYRRDVLLANGGFDGRVQYVEDQELSFRLAARGYRMVFQPGAAVYHHHANTIRGYASKKLHIGYWKSQIVRR
ncbi:MAG: glycosyltransferase, partial [Candidatus Promineifilaceae bacterium]